MITKEIVVNSFKNNLYKEFMNIIQEYKFMRGQNKEELANESTNEISSTDSENDERLIYQSLINALGGIRDKMAKSEDYNYNYNGYDAENYEKEEIEEEAEEEEYNEEDSGINNSDLSYSDKLIYLRLNDSRDRIEANKNRLDTSRRILEKNYLNLFKGNTFDDPLDFLISKVFTEGFYMKVYFTNLTFTSNNGYETKILSLRPAKEGVYLNEALPEGVTLIFKGHVYAGVFIIDEIHAASDSGYRDFEVEVNVRPFHSNIPEGRKDDFLRDIIDNAESLTEYTEEKLEEWEEYLAWRKEIARRQIAGCKYYKLTFDYENRWLVFWLVCEGEEEFKKFKRYLRRDVQAFNNSYSQDNWHFKFRNEENKKHHRDQSVELGRFKKIVEQYYLNENGNTEETDENLDTLYQEYDDTAYDEDSLDYDEEDDDEETNRGDINEKIKKKFRNPYVVKVAFELNREDADEIIEKNYDEEEIESFIREEVLSDYFLEGFLALSAVGDFALISRLERAIDQLKRDESYSPNLALWLFNIERAKLPGKGDNIAVSSWLNEGIEKNEDQKKAVIKMLSAPDLCLIQGPPGTGKTTVIAEAIYQFVRNGNRVLIASQSNDAVDNALERLANNSSIRAIRLGQKNRKRKNKDDSAVRKFAEENALDYFYSSLSEQLSETWLDKWKHMDTMRTQYQTDIRDASMLVQDIEELHQNINKKNVEIQSLLNERSTKEVEINRLIEINENINNEKRQGEAFVEFIKKGESARFTLSKNQLEVIFKVFNPILKNFSRFKIKLNPVPLEINDKADTNMLNENLAYTINSFWCLQGIKNKLTEGQTGDTSISKQLSLLEHKKVLIQDKLDKLDDEEADDDEYEQVLNERRHIVKQINELKKQANIISLTGAEKQILSLDPDAGFDTQETISPVHLKNLFLDIAPIMNQFSEVILNIENILDDYNQKNVVRDFSVYEDQLEVLNVRFNNLRNLQEEKRLTLKNKQSLLSELAKKYDLEQEATSDSIIKSIRMQHQTNENNISQTSNFRGQWEGLLHGFKQRLDDKDSRKYDKEYYQDIYVGACNVVGISCTDNMRSLSDKGYNEFDAVIIDEVSKATPPELLIPLMKGRKAILVGDHRQLPPLFNEHEKSYKEIINTMDETSEEIRDLMTRDNFNRFKNMVTSSLFKGYFEKADNSIKHSLFTQYRMHTDIMNIINRFYEGNLNSGHSSKKEDEIKNHGLTIRGVDSSRFIVPDKHAYWIDSSRMPDEKAFYESRPEGSTSSENILECYIIIELLKKVAAAYTEKGFNKGNAKKVGVISFYQLQVNRLKSMLRKERKSFDFSSLEIDINTVDRFQGKEKEIIITSLVRNTKVSRRSEDSHIAAFERINVAFSRAQEMLVIVGAKDMYAEQPVKLPNMNSVGEKTVFVYRNIIEELNRKACYFGSGKIINEAVSKEIYSVMEKEYGGKQ